jgi:hypothetical protein
MSVLRARCPNSELAVSWLASLIPIRVCADNRRAVVGIRKRIGDRLQGDCADTIGRSNFTPTCWCCRSCLNRHSRAISNLAGLSPRQRFARSADSSRDAVHLSRVTLISTMRSSAETTPTCRVPCATISIDAGEKANCSISKRRTASARRCERAWLYRTLPSASANPVSTTDGFAAKLQY